MTHLRIEQNNIQENVSSAVIEKLYELAISGDLDASSHLAGNLYVPATYQEYIDILTDQTNPKFRDLTITAGSIYIMFADPEVGRVMATQFGDGTNVSVSDLTGVTTLPSQLFYTNSNVSTFNELKNLRGITAIGQNCFAGSTIQSITLDNITTVYSFAFHNCSLSGEISMPNLTTIERNAFSSNSVTKINFGGSITSTPLAVCDSSRSLTQVSGLSNLTQIEDSSFRNTALTSCDIDFTKVTSTGSSAFENCSSLTISGDFQEMLTIGEYAYYRVNFTNGTLTCPKLTSLGGFAFRYSTGLTTVDFSGSTFTNIYNYTFSGCTNLTSVTLPSTCTALRREAFADCTHLTSINTGNITQLGGDNGANCFCGCSSLSSLDLHSVTILGAHCFNGTNITNLTLPAITYIYKSFSYNDKITKVDLGENLTQIEEQTFWDSAITTIIFRGNTPPSFSDPQRGNKFKYDQSNLTVYVPDAKISDYQTALPGVASCITGISNLPQ